MKRKSKLQKITPLLIGTCMLTFVAACGSNDDDDNGGIVQQEEVQQEGTFQAVLTPVNSSVSGAVSGTADFIIDSDQFEARVQLQNAPNAIHIQHVNVGTSCPTDSSDANGDGFVDVVEGSAVTGGRLIPLDSDLSSQSAGGSYPIGTAYSYDESTSLLAMLGDLRLPDTDTEDSLVKLGATEELNLEGKVVQIHGVPNLVQLPETVMGIDGLSAHRTLPIACGVITRVQQEDTTGATTGDTGATTGDTGATTGDTGATTGDTGATTGDTGATTGDTGATTGDTGATTGDTGATTGDEGATTGV